MYKFKNETCQELIDDVGQLLFKSGLGKKEFVKDIGISYVTFLRFVGGEKIRINSLRKIVQYAEKHIKKNNKNNL